MEAVILIGIVIVWMVIKGSQAVSDGVAQARIGRQMDEIRKANIESSRRLWDSTYSGE